MGNFPSAAVLAQSTKNARDTIVRDGQNKMQRYAREKMTEKSNLGYYEIEISYADLCKYCKDNSTIKDLCYLKPDGTLQDDMIDTFVEQLKTLGYQVQSGKLNITIKWKVEVPEPPSLSSSLTLSSASIATSFNP